MLVLAVGPSSQQGKISSMILGRGTEQPRGAEQSHEGQEAARTLAAAGCSGDSSGDIGSLSTTSSADSVVARGVGSVDGGAGPGVDVAAAAAAQALRSRMGKSTFLEQKLGGLAQQIGGVGMAAAGGVFVANVARYTLQVREAFRGVPGKEQRWRRGAPYLLPPSAFQFYILLSTLSLSGSHLLPLAVFRFRACLATVSPCSFALVLPFTNLPLLHLPCHFQPSRFCTCLATFCPCVALPALPLSALPFLHLPGHLQPLRRLACPAIQGLEPGSSLLDWEHLRVSACLLGRVSWL